MVAALQHLARVIGWQAAAYFFFVAFITHAGVYYGFLKPTGIALAINANTPGPFG